MASALVGAAWDRLQLSSRTLSRYCKIYLSFPNKPKEHASNAGLTLIGRLRFEQSSVMITISCICTTNSLNISWRPPRIVL